MSSTAAPTPSPRPAETPAVSMFGLGVPRPPRSEAARVVIQTFGQTGAIFGGLWVGLIAFFAVFAPFVASSHPILMQDAAGAWSSPMLRHLTPADVTLALGFFLGLVLLMFRRVRVWRRIGLFLLGVAIIVPLCLIYVQPPQTVVYDRYRVMANEGQVRHAYFTVIPYSPSDRLHDQFDMNNPHPRAPSAEHWMGTEVNGADVLSRMIHACRIAIGVGFVATGIAVTIGIIVGGIMGYFAGWVDLLGMRLLEIFSSIPTLFLILSIIAFWGSGTAILYLIVIVIGLTDFYGYALYIRAEFLKLRQQDFVQAARATGLPLRSILFRHMLPNGVTAVLVSASFGIAGAINIENVLSFLGIGLVEEPSWGQLLKQATGSGTFVWWLAIFPGLVLSLTMFAFVLIGEAMRDVIDPYTNRKA